MATFEYIYELTDFLNNEVDISKLDTEIRDSSIKVSLDYISSTEQECFCYFRDELSTEDEATLSGVVSVHDGVPDSLSDAQYVKIVGSETTLHVDLSDELRDRSGKLRVHQTSRKLGTMVLWSGEGDDPTNPVAVGGGSKCSFSYKIGQSDPLIKYIDFNSVENETWIHEGYITWSDAKMDTLDLQIVPRVTAVTSGTNYNIYNGCLIVPAIPGTGTVDLASDITQHDGGLVQVPLNDLGERSPAFWNATWDTVNKVYKDITAAPNGDGHYNMFSTEIIIAQFVRKMTLLDHGFIALNSSDTDQVGHGVRLKMIADTNTEDYGDHDWSVAVLFCLHRESSVIVGSI